MNAIGAYTLSNNSGILVYEIDYVEDKVLACFVYFDQFDKKIWCDIVSDEDERMGFMFNNLFVPFEEVMRV